MEWNQKLQQIIDYVEEHLQRKEEPIDHENIAKIAGCSFSFFQKTFSYMNNISFAEYVRARKLTLAGYDLKSTKMKVVEISYKYGYDSPTSFTKAFQKFHGISPTEARNTNAVLNVVPKMNILTNNKYNWQIIQKPSLRLIGKNKIFSTLDNNHYKQIPAFWDKCQKDGTFYKLISLDKNEPKGIFGVCGNYSSSNMEYAIMVNSDEKLAEYDEIIIPETTWVVFDCTGSIPQAIHNGWKYLNEEWLIKYPFKHAPYPELEWYNDGNVFSDDYLSQIWIPIIEEE